MAEDSSTAIKRRKPWKPAKPYPKFPLFPHDTGRWAKKVQKKILFFGRWGKQEKGKIVPVENVEQSALDAETEYQRQWPWISKGLVAPPLDAPAVPVQDGDDRTLMRVVNAFLTSKQSRLSSGELSAHTFAEYFRTSEKLLAHFGKTARVDELKPIDFQRFRERLARGCNSVTLASKINRCMVVLNHASENLNIKIQYGKEFDKPSEIALRKARNVGGERFIEAADLRKIIDGAPAVLKAILLLGVNCGFGNTDIACLPKSALQLDLNGGWVSFPRVKSGIKRTIPLWPETVAALRVALPLRPPAKDPADDHLAFLTERGTRWVRIQKSVKHVKAAKLAGKDEGEVGKFCTINALARRFELLVKELNLELPKGTGFYSLRHVFETIGGDSEDQVAVDHCMGHVDPSMGANYRHRISDERLRKVTNSVHQWLFAKQSKSR